MAFNQRMWRRRRRGGARTSSLGIYVHRLLLCRGFVHKKKIGFDDTRAWTFTRFSFSIFRVCMCGCKSGQHTRIRIYLKEKNVYIKLKVCIYDMDYFAERANEMEFLNEEERTQRTCNGHISF